MYIILKHKFDHGLHKIKKMGGQNEKICLSRSLCNNTRLIAQDLLTPLCLHLPADMNHMDHMDHMHDSTHPPHHVHTTSSGGGGDHGNHGGSGGDHGMVRGEVQDNAWWRKMEAAS